MDIIIVLEGNFWGGSFMNNKETMVIIGIFSITLIIGLLMSRF
jgi:hypothetical protein